MTEMGDFTEILTFWAVLALCCLKDGMQHISVLKTVDFWSSQDDRMPDSSSFLRKRESEGLVDWLLVIGVLEKNLNKIPLHQYTNIQNRIKGITIGKTEKKSDC